MQLKDIGDSTLWIGPLVDAATGAPVAVSVPWSSVSIDGDPLSGSSGSDFACVTNAQGIGQITLDPLAAGRFRIDVQVDGCLPWFEPCVEVGILESLSAIRNPAGAGAVAVILTVKTRTGKLLAGCGVAVYHDQACTEQVAETGTQFTDRFGKVTFNLDSGSYWFRKTYPGARFTTNPESHTVA